MSSNFQRRIFMGKPGIYARKEISPITEVQIPGLQAVVCIFVLFFDMLFILSWGLILPVEIIYVTSMVIIVILAPTLVAGLFFGFRKLFDWVGIFPKVLKVILWPAQLLLLFVRILSWCLARILRYSIRKGWLRIDRFLSKFLVLVGKIYQPIDKFLSDLPVFIEKHWTSIAIAAAAIVFLSTVIGFALKHDAWYDVCASLPHVDLPIPHVGGYSQPMLGICIAVIGMVGFAFRPGRYSLGMTAFGSIIAFCLQYFRPMTVKITYGWTLPLYAIWGSICLSVWVGTATLFLRFYIRDLLEYSDYPEQRASDPIENALDPENRSGYDRRFENG